MVTVIRNKQTAQGKLLIDSRQNQEDRIGHSDTEPTDGTV